MKWLFVILLGLLSALQYRLWTGEGSIAEIKEILARIEDQQQELGQLRARNKALEAEIRDLQQGLDAVEERARNEIGLIRQGETFYRIVDVDDKPKP